MKTRVNITQAHIDAGSRRDAYCCPLALAIRDAIGAQDGVSVGVFSEQIDFRRFQEGRPKIHERVRHTNHTRRFVTDVDCGEKVAPCMAMLDLPEWAFSVDAAAKAGGA